MVQYGCALMACRRQRMWAARSPSRCAHPLERCALRPCVGHGSSCGQPCSGQTWTRATEPEVSVAENECPNLSWLFLDNRYHEEYLLLHRQSPKGTHRNDQLQ